jgi:beta-galactosidase
LQPDILLIDMPQNGIKLIDFCILRKDLTQIFKPTEMKKAIVLILVLQFTLSGSAQRASRFFQPEDLISTGVYYYPEHWDSSQWERDLKNMAAMGFEYTHYAEFAWAQLEPEEGRYDFAWLDHAVALAAKYQLKVIMCTSTATPPAWLARKYPQVLETNENGQKSDHGSRQNVSFSSTFFREYALKMVEKLAIQYGKDKRIMGWQIDNEPRVFYDYGPEAQQRFRAWLKRKYGNIENLNRTWGTSFWSQHYNDYSQINIPLYAQWGMNLNQILDHTRFINEETATFLDDQARVIRKYAIPEQWITSNYIPNYNSGYIGMSRELDFVTYTKYMVAGHSRGIGLKGYRLGNPESIAMSNDFFRPIAGIYGVMELQPGQVNWGTVNSQPLPGAVHLWLWHVMAGGGNLACTYRYRAPLYGYEQYHYGIVGYDGVTPTPGGLEYQQFMKEIQLLRKQAVPGAKPPQAYANRKTAILFNVENIWGMDQNKQTTQWNSMGHITKYYKALKSFGAPVDFIRDTFDFKAYPVVIAPAYQQLDKALVDKWTEYVKNGGNLVLTCRTGHKDREIHLWEAKFAEPIWDLIGAEIEFYDLPAPYAPDTVVMQGKKYAWSSWGEIFRPLPGTETWATYAGDFYAGKPAVIFRRLGRGTVTYVGADSRDGLLEKEVLQKIYELLKIPVENYPDGVMVEYRDGFGIGMSYSDKDYELAIPPGAKILVGSKTLKPSGVVVWK